MKAAIANSEKDKKIEATKKAAVQAWVDPTLADWPESKISFSLFLPGGCVGMLWFYDL